MTQPTFLILDNLTESSERSHHLLNHQHLPWHEHLFCGSGRHVKTSKLWLNQAKWCKNISKSGVLHLTGSQNGISGATYVGDKGAQLAPGGARAIGQRVKRAGARFQFLHNCGLCSFSIPPQLWIVLAILRLCSPFSANCSKPVNIGRRNWNGRLRNLISSCLEIALFSMNILLFDSIPNLYIVVLFSIIFPVLQCIYCCLIPSICPRGHDARWYDCLFPKGTYGAQLYGKWQIL